MEYTIPISIREKAFPKLLEDPNVPSEDKKIMKGLLQKPWNPYIQRHYSLTEKAKILKESVLRVHAGWGMNSKMPQIYLHYYGNESSESLLEAYGIITKDQQQPDPLRPKQCPNCLESCRSDDRFCPKCRMIMSYDLYSETLERQKQKESEVQILKDKYEQDMKSVRDEMNQHFGQIMSMIQQNPQLAQVKPEALVQKKNLVRDTA